MRKSYNNYNTLYDKVRHREGRPTSQAIGRRPLTTESQVQSKTHEYGVCG